MKNNLIWVTLGIIWLSLLYFAAKVDNDNKEKDKIIFKQKIEIDSLKTKLDFCNGVNY